MRAYLAVAAIAFALGADVRAEIVEEVRWYNADGEVVKTVKRTITGEARSGREWEPAWVERERVREAALSGRYSSGRRYYGSGYFGPVYGGSYLFQAGTKYCGPRRYGHGGGFRMHVRTGGGATRRGFGYCGSGVGLFINR